MPNRMKAFDKCVDKLLDDVTSDLISCDEIAAAIEKVTEGAKKLYLIRKNKEMLEEIREETLEAFCVEVKKRIDTEIKAKFEKHFDELKDPENQSESEEPWRINGDPQHDTYAQRRQVYIDHQKKLDEVIEKLTEQRDSLLEKFQSK